MILRRLLRGGALLLALVVAAPCVTAAPADSLAQVPADAPVVIQFHGIERTKDRLLAMIKTALPEQHPLASLGLEAVLQNLPEGRKLKGLDKEAPIYAVLLELPDPGQAEPKMAVLVGVSDYKEFRDAILKEDERKALKANPAGYETTTVSDVVPLYLVDRSKEGYAVIARDEGTAKMFVKKPEKGLDKKVSPEVAKKFLAGDLGVYVDMAAVNKKYGDAIQAGKKTLQDALESGAGDKNTQELLKKVIDPVFQAIGDGQAVLATIEFRPEGMNMAFLGEVDAKSKTNDLLKDAKPGPVAELEKLPSGQQQYSALQLRGSVLKEFGNLIFGALGKEGDPGFKAMKEAIDAFAAAKPKIQVGSMSYPARSLTVIALEEPAKAVEAQLKMFKAMKGGSTFSMAPLKGDPVVKEKAEKYGSFELHSFSAKWDFEKLIESQAGNPITADKEKFTEYMKSMMGEGANVWFGTDGKVMLSVNAKTWDDAKKLIDDYVNGTKPIGDQQAFKDVRNQMPAETTALILTDLPSYTNAVDRDGPPVPGRRTADPAELRQARRQGPDGVHGHRGDNAAAARHRGRVPLVRGGA